MFRSIGFAEVIVIALLFLVSSVATLIPLCRITERTGYSGWWGLLNLLPFGTLIWACFVAFSKWPRDASAR
jgi:hypothetical protein